MKRESKHSCKISNNLSAILQEHEANLEKEFKFNEAANVRERINNLKLLEEEKLRSHSNKTHKEEQTLLDQVKQDEIDRFNEEYDNLYNELSRKCNEMQQQLLDQQKEDMENQVKEFHETFPKENPKLSTEILDLYRKMEYNAKKKE